MRAKMLRREFIGLIGTAALSFPRPTHAQTKIDLPLVGFLVIPKSDTSAYTDRLTALRKGLQQEGLTEGAHYSLVVRSAEGDLSRYPQLATELGALNSRVIVVMGSLVGMNEVRRRFPELPLVFTSIAADLIGSGTIQSYARPGGMLTGNVMNAVGGEETVTQKRIQLFKELVPDLRRLGMIAPANAVLATQEKDALQKVAVRLGFEFALFELNTMDDLEHAIAAARRDNVSAFYISGATVLTVNMSRVVTLVTASRKPAVGPYPDWGRAGLLMSYSTDPVDGVRHAGTYAAKILKGAKPGELPVEQASKFMFVINLKTAKALGIDVPPTLLALADEVIE